MHLCCHHTVSSSAKQPFQEDSVPAAHRLPLFTTSQVLLQQIDLDDHTFSLLPAKLDTALPAELADSLSRVGLIHPPILRLSDKGTYQVVSGRKRIRLAAERLAWNRISCLLLTEDYSDPDTLTLVLEETLACRRPSPAEAATFCAKIVQWLGEEEAAARYLPLLGLEKDLRILQRHAALAKLEEPLLLALHQGKLKESVARELVGLTFVDRMALFEIIDLLSLSASNQKKIVTVCLELASRQKSTIYSILAEQDMQEILEHPHANPPQKTANLMALLNKKRSPLLSEAEDEFRRFAAGLHLPKNAHLSHSQSFERDTLTLSIEFNNREKLQETWTHLAGPLAKI
jgi:ParB family chromosome partitioning protein